MTQKMTLNITWTKVTIYVLIVSFRIPNFTAFRSKVTTYQIIAMFNFVSDYIYKLNFSIFWSKLIQTFLWEPMALETSRISRKNGCQNVINVEAAVWIIFRIPFHKKKNENDRSTTVGQWKFGRKYFTTEVSFWNLCPIGSHVNENKKHHRLNRTFEKQNKNSLEIWWIATFPQMWC